MFAQTFHDHKQCTAKHSISTVPPGLDNPRIAHSNYPTEVECRVVNIFINILGVLRCVVEGAREREIRLRATCPESRGRFVLTRAASQVYKRLSALPQLSPTAVTVRTRVHAPENTHCIAEYLGMEAVSNISSMIQSIYYERQSKHVTSRWRLLVRMGARECTDN